MGTLVLNLPRSLERRAWMERQLLSTGLAGEFLNAIDGESLDGGVPSGLSRLEWACLLTHRAAWQRASIGAEPTLILEDDVQLTDELPEILSAIAPQPGPLGVVLFGHHSSRRGPSRGAYTTFGGVLLPKGHRLGRVVEFAMGAYAYLVSPPAARALLEFSGAHCLRADWTTGYAPLAGVGLLAVSPPCVVPADLAKQTTISDRRAPSSGSLQARDPEGFVSRAWLFMRRLGVWPSAYALHPRVRNHIR